MSELLDDLASLAEFGGGRSGVTRFAWSPELAAANEWLIGRFRDAGLETDVDAAGNVFGRWGAKDAGALLVGSHIDTVPNGGRYDGALGVLSAVHAVRLLRRDAFSPARPIVIAAFNDEEGARFGTGLFGSRAFVGDLPDCVGERVGADGLTLREAMAEAGFDFDRLPGARAVHDVSAYLELHIEQGPVLADEGTDIGVVTGIVGVDVYRVRLRGQANHAGTTPMSRRRDAFAGAARIALELRETVASRQDGTVNVGTITVEPGGYNVVPGASEFTIDIRALDAATATASEQLVTTTVERVAADEGLQAAIGLLHRLPPVATDPDLRAVIAQAAALEGASAIELPSGAGHDAMNLAAHVPVGMIFVPSRDGISHSPDEYTPPDACETGARVLARAIAAAAGRSSDPR